MSTLRARLIALGILGFFMGIGGIAAVLTTQTLDQRGAYAVVGGIAGWAFIYTGLYAWWRRPSNRSGALMALVGFTFFAGTLSHVDNSVLFIAGILIDSIPLAILAHLILAFPEGRLETRYHRRLVAFGYMTASVLQLPVIAFWDTPTGSDCRHCPSNPLLISSNESAYEVFHGMLNVAAVIAIVLVAREVYRRVHSARGSQRALYNPVLRAGQATLVAFGLLFASVVVSGPGAAALQLLAFCLFLTVPFAFLAGLVRGRITRADAVAAVVERLGRESGDQRSLRATLAEALGDPSLAVAYWFAARRVYVDADGARVTLPEPGSMRIATPVEREGNPIAVIIHNAALAEDEDLVRAVGAAAALALENERLTAELRARVEELRASRARVVRAGDEERRRLERDLHDGAQQRLVALALNLKLARASLESDPAGAAELLDDAVDELSAATKELRELARGIHPAVLTDRGLEAAVTALAARASVPVELLALPDERLDAPVESTAYFVVAESLTNVARYSRASYAEVDIHRENGHLVVEVRDDGVGGADPARGSGLRGLADRVGAVDGHIAVTSPPGAGTVVHVEIPCER